MVEQVAAAEKGKGWMAFGLELHGEHRIMV